MEHVVHQDHRPVKGPDGPHLVGQGGIEGIGLHGKAGDIRLIDLVCVQSLCDGIGHRHPPEDFSKGYTDALPQRPGLCGMGRDTVAGRDAPQQPLVYHARRHGQNQAAGIHLCQRLLQPPVGGGNGGEYPGIGTERGLDGGLNIAGEYDGTAHVYGEQLLSVVRHRGGDKTLEIKNLPDIRHCGLRRTVESEGELLPQGQGQDLRQEQLTQIQLPDAFGDVNAADDQHPPAGLPADEGCQLGVAQPREKAGGLQALKAGKAQGCLAPAEDAQMVPQPPQGPEKALRLRISRQNRGTQGRLRLPIQLQAPLEIQLLQAQQGLVLGLPEIQAVKVDKLLGHRVDEVGHVPALIDGLPNAGGADLLQMGGQLQLYHLSANGAVVVKVPPSLVPAEDDMIECVDGILPRLRPVTGGPGHHVAARHDGHLPVRESGAECRQILRIGDVHRKILRENGYVEFIRRGQRGQPAADAVRLGLLGPGKLVNGQQHLISQVPDGPDNPFVG